MPTPVNTRGERITPNRHSGWSCQAVALANSTAKTCTHNAQAIPLAIMLFDQTDSKLIPDSQVAVTNPNTNAFTLTPSNTGACNANVLVIWDVPTAITADVMPTFA
jgi:hypothetical protein